MKKSFVIVFFFYIFFCLPEENNKQGIIEAAKKAYIYAYPLVLVDTTKKIMTSNNTIKDPMKPQAHINSIIHVPTFPDATFTAIVRPNVDTLYSFAWIDLEREPVVVALPDTHDRYYVAEFMDAWTNVFASLGKRTTGTCSSSVAFVGPWWKGELPKGMKRIKAPTNSIWLLLRIQTNGKKDYSTVHNFQKGFTVTPLSAWNKKSTSAKLEEQVSSHETVDLKTAPVDQVVAMDASRFFTLFAQALKKNPPLAGDKPMLNVLKIIGIVPGKDFVPDITILQAMQKGIQAAKKEMQEKSTELGNKENGWLMVYDAGAYGTDYLKRAVIANIGVGANLVEDALYPTTFVDKDGEQLSGKNNYILHFEKKEIPPVNAFWSVTLYNAKSFLSANKLNRYGLGDRDSLRFNKDGSLDIYIQHENPGKDKESNWLPAPLEDFNLSMRLYWPKNEVLHKWWIPPAIKKVKDEKL
jgi:hypothetical protein